MQTRLGRFICLLRNFSEKKELNADWKPLSSEFNQEIFDEAKQNNLSSKFDLDGSLKISESIEQSEVLNADNLGELPLDVSSNLPLQQIPSDSILATRPAKGALWGDGEVFLKYQKVKFKQSKSPSLKRLQRFLEHEQGRDICIIDVKQYSKNTLFNTLLLCSGVTPRHISRMAYSLLKALKTAQVPDSDLFQVLGTRDSGWMLVTMKDLYIYLMTEETRVELDIENFWKNPMSEQDVQDFRQDEFAMYRRFKKKR